MCDLPRVYAFTENSWAIGSRLHDEATCRAAIKEKVGQGSDGVAFDRATLHLRHGAYRWVPTGGGEYDFILHQATKHESGIGQFFATEVEW